MGSYPINESPTTTDDTGGLTVFHEIRVCLKCARITIPQGVDSCPYCDNPTHTRTYLISHVTIVDGRPKVTIRNFGND